MPFTRDGIKGIICKLIAYSGCKNCSFRYLLSTGIDGYHPKFYCIVEDGIPQKPLEGCKDLYYSRFIFFSTFFNPLATDEMKDLKNTANKK